jgi:acyl carrier protein
MDHKSMIRQFMQRLLAQKGDQRPFGDGDSLLLSGRMQSVDAVEVVLFLEEQWGIDFAEIGFDEAQLDSVNAIDALVQNAGLQKSL